MGKNWVLSQSGEKCLQSSPIPAPHKEISAKAPEENLWAGPQIERPRTECAWAMHENMRRA